MTFRFSFNRPSRQRFEARLAGPLDQAALLRLETELNVRLAHAPLHQLHVLFDLCGVTDYDLEARDLFVRVQSFVASRARRTAYLADRPHLRALALWTVRMSGDAHASVVDRRGAAEAWLEVEPPDEERTPTPARTT